MEETKKKKSSSKKKSSKSSTSTKEHKKKKEKKEKKEARIDSFVDEQQMIAKQQAETLRKHSAKLKNPPELANNPNAGGSDALRLRLDLNLDADIKLKARIKGSIILTLQ